MTGRWEQWCYLEPGRSCVPCRLRKVGCSFLPHAKVAGKWKELPVGDKLEVIARLGGVPITLVPARERFRALDRVKEEQEVRKAAGKGKSVGEAIRVGNAKVATSPVEVPEPSQPQPRRIVPSSQVSTTTCYVRKSRTLTRYGRSVVRVSE